MALFDPAVWGTVGQWASAVGTTAAFSATFYVIWRDAKVRRLMQARKIAFYVDIVDRNQDEIDPHDPSSGVWYDVTLKNLSEEPIYDIDFYRVEEGKSIDSLTQRSSYCRDRAQSFAGPSQEGPDFGKLRRTSGTTLASAGIAS